VGERVALFLLSALLVVVPFFVVTFPPITDLPQHLAQLRLVGVALAEPSSLYQIQWWTPYSLLYALMGLCEAVASSPTAGRPGIALIALLWVVTAHGLAVSRGRSSLAAVLASLFVFSNVLYWGFLNFAIGWPVFAVWMFATAREIRRPRQVLLLGALGLVLYACHALWLLAGAAWLGVITVANLVEVRRRRGALRQLVRPLIWRACALAPAATALALWTPSFQASEVSARPALWNTNLLTRLNPEWLVNATLGGLRGPLEWLLLAFAFAWLALGVVQHRWRLREAVDGRLLLGAALLVLFALVLPDKYVHTIQLAERWMPGAAVLLVLALPAPRLRPTLAGVAGIFVATTALTWVAFGRRELTGLAASLERLPAQQRVPRSRLRAAKSAGAWTALPADLCSGAGPAGWDIELLVRVVPDEPGGFPIESTRTLDAAALLLSAPSAPEGSRLLRLPDRQRDSRRACIRPVGTSYR